jgi:hypothetical protein
MMKYCMLQFSHIFKQQTSGWTRNVNKCRVFCPMYALCIQQEHFHLGLRSLSLSHLIRLSTIYILMSYQELTCLNGGLVWFIWLYNHTVLITVFLYVSCTGEVNSKSRCCSICISFYIPHSLTVLVNTDGMYWVMICNEMVAE